ncbi:uncharacterized protein [Dermacentor albipictus]|uniref:uncharacterized protein n=1 Tax=Dermacentor albipictus TaxID=60249 RepID=UPI0038FC68AA
MFSDDGVSRLVSHQGFVSGVQTMFDVDQELSKFRPRRRCPDSSKVSVVTANDGGQFLLSGGVFGHPDGPELLLCVQNSKLCCQSRLTTSRPHRLHPGSSARVSTNTQKFQENFCVSLHAERHMQERTAVFAVRSLPPGTRVATLLLSHSLYTLTFRLVLHLSLSGFFLRHLLLCRSTTQIWSGGRVPPPQMQAGRSWVPAASSASWTSRSWSSPAELRSRVSQMHFNTRSASLMAGSHR